MRSAIVLNEKDNVATAIEPLKPGDFAVVSFPDKKEKIILICGDIPYGHKFSVSNIHSGSPIIKYGETIGNAISTISIGQYVHIHNVESLRGRGDNAK